MKNISSQQSKSVEYDNFPDFEESDTDESPIQGLMNYESAVKHTNEVLSNDKGKVRDFDSFISELRVMLSMTVRTPAIKSKPSQRQGKKLCLDQMRNFKTDKPAYVPHKLVAEDKDEEETPCFKSKN